MKMPRALVDLVEKFDSHYKDYKLPSYNETQVRREFIDPFFKSLGWDVDNEKGYSEKWKEVVHEAAINIGGVTKTPDYSFRLGGRNLFYLEAKKPSIDLQNDPSPAFQLRRYAWTSKLPVSILTDFEYFIVYDTRHRPALKDKPSKGRIINIHYTEYESKWHVIASLFSPDSIRQGAFDKYILSTSQIRGTGKVDDDFLKEIEEWRVCLARNIAIRNTNLKQEELNFAVQKIIDRIIFLRICEDRGIEEYGKLQALLNGSNTYLRLQDMFRKADERYNSGLFHFQKERNRPGVPDVLTPSLKIDDKAIKYILKRLYYPECPYEFSVLPTETLGNVYERFLGSSIRLTEGGRAKIEQKPEVRKAGGVYYTPSWIVEYIIEQTVGNVLIGKTPQEVAGVTKNWQPSKRGKPVTILDPACGSGSFLIGAYQYLLDWHLEQYNMNTDKYSKMKDPKIYHHYRNGWRLTTNERKRILLTNIYGVDIDSQAVEVTKLSLLLKVLEGESEETIEQQFQLWQDRALPDLGNNIKCGNSLISTDYLNKHFLSEEEVRLVNPFNWNVEYAEIIKNGGFDCIVGNPPYLNIDDTWGKSDVRLQAIKASFPEIYNDKTDILIYFIGKSVKLSKGYVSFIISRAFLEAYKADKIRRFLLEKTAIKEIIDFQNYYVFNGVGITTCILTVMPGEKPGDTVIYKMLKDKTYIVELTQPLHNSDIFEKIINKQDRLSHTTWSFSSNRIQAMYDKIDSISEPLSGILFIGKGMETGRNNVFGKKTIDEIHNWQLEAGFYFKRAANSDIQPFYIKDRGEYILYLECVEYFKQLPLGIQEYFKKHSKELKKRAAYKRGDCKWWKFTWPLHKDYYNRKKILCPYLASNNRFAIDEQSEYLGLTDTTILFDSDQKESLLYLLGLLNSRLLSFRFKGIGKLKSNGIYEYFWNSVSNMPIRRIDFDNPNDVKYHDKIVALVNLLQELHRKNYYSNLPNDKLFYQRRIITAENQLNNLVYELYCITEDEIKVVEKK